MRTPWPARGSRRWMRGAAALVVCAASLAACSGDGERAGTTTSAPTGDPADATVTTAPAGPPPGATEQGLRELAVGDCFDLVDDPVAQDRAVWLIDCANPHSHEVFDVVAYDAEGSVGGSPYPGVAVVQNWAEDACHSRFEAFVGLRWTLSELEIQVWWPSEESWDLMDREVICTVFSPSGDPLVGTQRGAEI